VMREEGGTPAIIDSIRAGLVFQLKQAVGLDVIRAHEEHYLRRAVAAWLAEPSIEILGNLDAERLSIVSFVVRSPSGRYLHHNFVVALLNDLFGIQARGGCSCAGPYGHRLLGIGDAESLAFRGLISRGHEGFKPGWTRISLNYFLSGTVTDYLLDAVALVARHGHRLLTDYRFDPGTGLWSHRSGAAGTVHLADLGLGACSPAPPPTMGEEVLATHLEEGRRLLEARPDVAGDDPGLPADVEALRWFRLPRACL